MAKKKIVVCDAIHEAGFKLLRKEEDVEVIDASKEPKDKLLDIIADADVVITRSPTEVGEAFLNAVKNLKAIVRAGVGVDNVDIEGCSKKGIIVMNVPTANTIAAVELTMAHMLSCARSFPYAHNDLKQNRIWNREKWYGIELSGKKLGIIGFGNIGSRVGVRALAFGMDVITYDPYIPSSKATDLGVKYTTNFDDILECDFITIHTPKTKETINMISYEEIEKMKDGVILINCARGGLYNEDALYDALKKGKVRFAGIDVFAKEPAVNNKLLDLDNVTVTPHLGANTYESQRKIATQAAEAAISALRGTSYPNALNLPIKEGEIPEFVKPYVELIQKMSYLAAQINKHPISSIKLVGEGEIADYLNQLKTFAIVGALKESLGEQVNYVNAEFIAKEKDIEIKTQKQPNMSAFKNRVTVKMVTNNGVTKISGTVFSENIQRIVEINNIKLDIEPKGKMIIFENKDVPGVIAQIATILSEHNINIADFRLGRDDKDLALAVILVDQSVPKEVIRELENLESCIWVAYAVI